MVILLLLGLAAVLRAGAATAAAWPRDEGRWFLALSYSGWGNGAEVLDGVSAAVLGSSGSDLNQEFSVYLDYGLTPQVTVGLDRFNRFNGVETESWGFARWHPGPSDATNRFAFGLGLGQVTTELAGDDDTGGGIAARFSAAWGRGFPTRFGNGWVDLVGQAAWIDGTPDHYVKADLTLGVSPAEGKLAMVQFLSGQYGDADPYLRMAPSYVFSLREGVQLETGLTIGLVNDDRVGLKIGTWIEF